MRLLNSICKLLADNYKNISVYIMNVPEGFKRPSFMVTLASEGSTLLNRRVYRDTPIFEIVYFGRLNAAEQSYAEGLYNIKEELKALFLLPGAIPLIQKEGEKEKTRYAKITSYSSEVRLAEKSLYVKLGLDFTDDTQQEEQYELIKEVDLVMTQAKIY